MGVASECKSHYAAHRSLNDESAVDESATPTIPRKPVLRMHPHKQGRAVDMLADRLSVLPLPSPDI